MEIRTNGYYVSEGIPWEDSQSGHRFHGIHYKFLYFRADGKYFMSSGDTKEFNLDQMHQQGVYGNYSVEENIVEILYNPESNFPVQIEFTILAPDTLLDKNLVEYNFVEVV